MINEICINCLSLNHYNDHTVVQRLLSIELFSFSNVYQYQFAEYLISFTDQPLINTNQTDKNPSTNRDLLNPNF